MIHDRPANDLDLASSINAMVENTTAAELVRRQGQTKRVKVLSERKLMDWISAMMAQQLAAKEDSFSDAEKEELLRKTQEELALRFKREQLLERERAAAQADLEKALAQVAATQGGGQDFEQALETLKARLAESETKAGDLQQDTFELEDQLQEKLSLLSTTISEKDKLRDTVRRQMIRSGALIEGVLGLDQLYYGSRHAEELPVREDASDEERFFHDFDIGTKIIESLRGDLERLRGITATAHEAAPSDHLLANDLELLAQLKSGNLHAVDVAAPVANLLEALDGARTEAMAFQGAIAQATGSSRSQHHLSLISREDDAPAEVLAEATSLVRELAAEFARSRTKVTALQAIAQEADEARNGIEEELEALKAAQAATPRPEEALKALAMRLVEATKNDAHLAEAAADLAIEVDDGNGDLAAGILALVSQALQRRI